MTAAQAPQASAFRIEPYAEALHYPLLVDWWLGHGDEPALPDHLPGSGRPGMGFVACAPAGFGLACGFVYETGTAFWLGPHYLMVNPALHESEGGKVLGNAALDAVMDALEAYVAGSGGGALATFSNLPAAIARGRRHGLQLRGRIPMLGKWVPARTSDGILPAGDPLAAHWMEPGSQGGACE